MTIFGIAVRVLQQGRRIEQNAGVYAFPGTPLYHRLKQEGRILREKAWELCTLFDINFRPKNMSVAELQSGFLDLVKRLYSAEETAERRTKFKQMLKKSPHFGPRARHENLLAA